MAEAPAHPARAAAWLLALGLAITPAVNSVSSAQVAQEAPVALVADQVSYDQESGLLIAEGNVEVLYQDRALRAPRLVYDQRAGEVRAQGPIVLVDPATGVLIADSATLTPDLAEGLIAGARVLINDQLQIAAVEGRRVDGRLVTLDRVIASTCTICPENPTPTWAIRARRVTQDEAAQRIYFEGARLEVIGVPVAYLPRLSIPDPAVERASGFLAPEFLSSGIYGFGAKQPYYLVISPSADATITPFVTSQGGLLMEGEYRRRFGNGSFDVDGVVAIDDGLDQSLGTDSLRWSFSGVGDFALPRGFVADFDIAAVSDDVFLQQFDYSDADLLTSIARVRRTRAKDDFELAAIGFQSLIQGDDAAKIPAILPDLAYRRVLEDTLIGGRVAIDLAALGVVRRADGSMIRATGGADWRRDWTLPRGLRLGASAGAALDSYQTWDYIDYVDGLKNRATPEALVELRWPFVRRDPGADHLIEPILQMIWSDSLGDTDVPNEDSTLPEFSYSNLFSTNQFPGRDRLETGARANIGVQYLREDPDGWNLGLTFGRVLRFSDLDQFPEGTGLDGRWSDYVGEVSVGFDWGMTLSNRTLIASDLDLTRNEFAMTYENAVSGLVASYIYLAADDTNPALGPQPETSEFAMAARYRVLPNWELRGNWRYDLVSGANLRAGGGVTYGNECAEIDLSISRRYTSSDNLPPSTTIGFGLRLAGFGAGQSQDWPPRTCSIVGLP